MHVVTTRPATPAELDARRKSIAALTADPGHGCVFYAVLVCLVPLALSVIGVFIRISVTGSRDRSEVALFTVFIPSFLIAAMTAILLATGAIRLPRPIDRRLNRWWYDCVQVARAAIERDIQQAAIETWQIEADRAWRAEAIDDEAPAFWLRVDAENLIYLNSHALYEVLQDKAESRVPAHLTVELWAASRETISIQAPDPRRLDVQSLSLSDLEFVLDLETRAPNDPNSYADIRLVPMKDLPTQLREAFTT